MWQINNSCQIPDWRQISVNTLSFILCPFAVTDGLESLEVASLPPIFTTEISLKSFYCLEKLSCSWQLWLWIRFVIRNAWLEPFWVQVACLEFISGGFLCQTLNHPIRTKSFLSSFDRETCDPPTNFIKHTSSTLFISTVKTQKQKRICRSRASWFCFTDFNLCLYGGGLVPLENKNPGSVNFIYQLKSQNFVSLIIDCSSNLDEKTD